MNSLCRSCRNQSQTVLPWQGFRSVCRIIWRRGSDPAGVLLYALKVMQQTGMQDRCIGETFLFPDSSTSGFRDIGHSEGSWVKMMKRLLLVWVMILFLLPVGGWAEETFVYNTVRY